MENIDQLIHERFAERQRKLDFIAERKALEEATAKRVRRNWYITSTAIAAIAIIALVVAPMLHHTPHLSGLDLAQPQFEDFRGGPDAAIEAALADADYPRVLSLLDVMIADTKDQISQLEASDDASDETRYSLALTRDYYGELLWTKIYAMAMTDQTAGLKELVEEYLAIKPNQPHGADAEKILAEL